VAYFASTVAWWNVVPATIGVLNATRPYGSIPIGLLVAVTLLNPVFEAFLFLGFGIAGLERVSLRLACVVSIVLRAIIHLYQGMAAIVGVLPIGVVFICISRRHAAFGRRSWPTSSWTRSRWQCSMDFIGERFLDVGSRMTELLEWRRRHSGIASAIEPPTIQAPSHTYAEHRMLRGL
jgi:hypothetical protein